MSEHPLDRPIWHALSTRQSDFALGNERALRFLPDVAPFAAARDDSSNSLEGLARIVPAEGVVVLLQAGESPLPPGTKCELTASGVQMVLGKLAPLRSEVPIERLTEADALDMLALATLTKPGPFLPRTHLLGDFWGVKENGRLVAMAGERIKLEGLTEVSGVCTHPDFRGRGLAAILSHKVAVEILARENALLHAYANNSAAIRVYEALGFVLRRVMVVTALSRAA